jgi:ribose 5-phosphate isomerase B
MRVALASDHTGLELRAFLRRRLESQAYQTLDLGADTAEAVDYPLYGEKIARAVLAGQAERGIAICGTGAGISLAANKVRGIRAVLCSEPYTAQMAVLHNNAQILCLGARVVGLELAALIVDTFLAAEFEGLKPGGERHQRRVDMIMRLEQT